MSEIETADTTTTLPLESNTKSSDCPRPSILLQSLLTAERKSEHEYNFWCSVEKETEMQVLSEVVQWQTYCQTYAKREFDLVIVLRFHIDKLKEEAKSLRAKFDKGCFPGHRLQAIGVENACGVLEDVYNNYFAELYYSGRQWEETSQSSDSEMFD